MPPKKIKPSHLQPRAIDNNEINRIFVIYTSPSLPTTTISGNNNNDNPSSSSAKTTQSNIKLSYDELLEQYLILKEENDFLKNNWMPK
jgi:hypothetical protein